MKSYKIILALGVSLLALVACQPKATIKCTVAGAPSTKLAVHKLNVSATQLLDSVKTDAQGRFSYKVDIKKNQPEFIYVYYKDEAVASLLLDAGDKVSVRTDTLGHAVITGSPASLELAEVDAAFNEFLEKLMDVESSQEASKLYVDYYRGRVRYVMEHPYSLTVIPVLFQNLGTNLPVFSQGTDAIHFRAACDSLKKVYPDSRYVKALERETERREQFLGIQHAFSNAKVAGFPDLVLPDVKAEKVSLAGVDSKAILVHFWDVNDPAQKIFNTDKLLPLYKEFHKKGLEIYSVCISSDKALWASVVKNQKLPWINVCDGLGSASPAVATYNLQSLPATLLIGAGELVTKPLVTEQDLRNELNKILK